MDISIKEFQGLFAKQHKIAYVTHLSIQEEFFFQAPYFFFLRFNFLINNIILFNIIECIY